MDVNACVPVGVAGMGLALGSGMEVEVEVGAVGDVCLLISSMGFGCD